MTKRVLAYEDIERVVQFLVNFTEVNGIILPGRVAAFHRWDVKVLPSSETRSSVWRKYKSAMTTSGLYWQTLCTPLILVIPSYVQLFDFGDSIRSVLVMVSLVIHK